MRDLIQTAILCNPAIAIPDNLSKSGMTDQAKAFLKWDVEREEGYLELPDHPDFRLTPARPEDDEDMVSLSLYARRLKRTKVKMYNDPTVYRFMDRALSVSRSLLQKGESIES